MVMAICSYSSRISQSPDHSASDTKPATEQCLTLCALQSSGVDLMLHCKAAAKCACSISRKERKTSPSHSIHRKLRQFEWFLQGAQVLDHPLQTPRTGDVNLMHPASSRSQKRQVCGMTLCHLPPDQDSSSPQPCWEKLQGCTYQGCRVESTSLTRAAERTVIGSQVYLHLLPCFSALFTVHQQSSHLLNKGAKGFGRGRLVD